MSEEMTLVDACAATAQFGRFLKGMERLQQTAAALAGADQLLAERGEAAARLLAQIAAATAELEALKTEHESLSQRCAEQLATAQAAAASQLEIANTVAKKIIEDAHAEERQARSDAQDVVARAAAAARELNDAQAELERVNARISLVKAEALKSLGG